jgi:hypothetical protein
LLAQVEPPAPPAQALSATLPLLLWWSLLLSGFLTTCSVVVDVVVVVKLVLQIVLYITNIDVNVGSFLPLLSISDVLLKLALVNGFVGPIV